MNTECTPKQMEFHDLGRRAVIGKYDGGEMSSDGGGLLLREVDERTHILKRLAGCFVDYRDKELIEHTVDSLIRQRVYGIALGYEDLIDYDALRHDILMALLSEKRDPRGGDRVRPVLMKPDPNFPDLKPLPFADRYDSWVLSIGIENEMH